MLAALKARIPAAQREWLRSAVRGNPYRVERPSDPVRIGEIVSPLRYDVLARVGHFEFIAEHRSLFDEDLEAYQAKARELAYFVWFKRVMAPSWLPELNGDADALEAAWRSRLRASVALYDSFHSRGFDNSAPVELHAGFSVRPTHSGKRPTRDLYAGDGNHRLALLMAAGQDMLEPEQYRVRRYRFLVPADTTGLLVERTGASWADYEAFIKLGYPGVELELVDGRVTVTASDDATIQEVEALAAEDLPRLKGART